MIAAKSQPADCCCSVSVVSRLVQTRSTSAGLSASIGCPSRLMGVLSQAATGVFSISHESRRKTQKKADREWQTDILMNFCIIHNWNTQTLPHRNNPAQTHSPSVPFLFCLSLLSAPPLSRVGPFEVFFPPHCLWINWSSSTDIFFISLHLLSLFLGFYSPLMSQNTDAATVIIILWAARWIPAKCTLHVPAVPQRLHTHTDTKTHTCTSVCTQISVRNNERL